MATQDIGILTNAGKDLIDKVNAGQTKLTFSKVVFSTDDLTSYDDSAIKELVTLQNQNVTVAPPTVTLDDTTGETKVRAVGLNHVDGNTSADLTDGIYVKTYGVFAKDDSGTESLYGVTVTSHPDYLPAYDGMIPQAIAYSYKFNISDTNQVNFTNAVDVYLTLDDLNGKLGGFVKQADLEKYATNDKLTEVVTDMTDLLKSKADDSNTVHKSGDEEIAGTKTFDTPPVDKTTGKPFISNVNTNALVTTDGSSNGIIQNTLLTTIPGRIVSPYSDPILFVRKDAVADKGTAITQSANSANTLFFW